ncbi:MAG: DUF3995 domain-containing protein [Spirochaetia bacterium]|nr:DUF3995 domain-containing protein [Spirochaetia bacterium]
MTVAIVAAIFCAITCGAIALLHAYWALGGRIGKFAALPEQDGKPVFLPSKFATWLVAIALAFASLVALRAGDLIYSSFLNSRISHWFCLGMAIIFLLRAIGDFKLVGFGKKVRGTQFARQDTLYYSPLCVLLSLGFFAVGFS